MRLTARRVVERLPPSELVTTYRAHGWEVRFHDPFEVRMGNHGWQVSLFHDDVDVTAGHPILWSLQANWGLNIPSRYQPWCSTRPILALNAWDRAVRVYDVVERSGHAYAVGLPREIQWSPRGERLAVTAYDRIVVIDATTGSSVGVSPPMAPDQGPRAFWWPDGEHLLVVNRPAPAEATQLLLVSARDGQILRQVDFDPAGLLPYDAESFRAASRDGFSLLVNDGPESRPVSASDARAWGFLLDSWNRVDFDPQARVLRATVYRPVGEHGPLVGGGHACVVHEQAVEVAVDADL